MFIKYTYKRI